MEWLESTDLWTGAAATWDWFWGGIAAFLGAFRDALTSESAPEAFRNLLWGLGVFAAIYGIYLPRRRTQTDRKRQVSDSFTKAVELLGHEKRSIRVGALFALERIMVENRDLHRQVVETICGYARERSRLERKALAAGCDWIAAPDGALIGDDPIDAQQVSEDIAAVVAIIARRPWRREGGWRIRRFGWRIRIVWASDAGSTPSLNDLRAPGMQALGWRLAGIFLRRADLNGADLSSANLRGTILSSANLSGAYMSYINLSRAVLFQADLSRAKMYKANLRQSVLPMTNLDLADLSGADLRRSKFVNVQQILKAELDPYTQVDRELGI